MKEGAASGPTSAIRRRRVEVMVAPVVTFAVILVGLLWMRAGLAMPWRSGPCGFWEAFERPCPACGGTRAAQALAKGEWSVAWRTNPAVPTGSIAALLWLAAGAGRYLAGSQPLDAPATVRRMLIGGTLATTMLVANWIYLLSIH